AETDHRDLCDADVLRRIRRRSLAHLRAEVEAVPPAALGAYLPRWQYVNGDSRSRAEGPGLAVVLDQLAGARVPASALEQLVLPARVAGYAPNQLDELTAAGEVLWSGAGSLPGVDGYLALVPADAPELLPDPEPLPEGSAVHEALLEVLADGGGRFFR